MDKRAGLGGGVTREEARSAAKSAEQPPVLVWATTGEGIEALLQAIDARLGRRDEIIDLVIPAEQGRLINWIYEEAELLERENLDSGEVRVRVRVAAEKKPRLLAQMRSAGTAAAAG